jgi:hypothetical protein
VRTVGEYKVVTTNEQAIAEGFPNLASYQMAVRKEIAARDAKAYAEYQAQHQARLTKKLQTPPNPTSFYVGAFPKAPQG